MHVTGRRSIQAVDSSLWPTSATDLLHGCSNFDVDRNGNNDLWWWRGAGHEMTRFASHAYVKLSSAWWCWTYGALTCLNRALWHGMHRYQSTTLDRLIMRMLM